MNARRKPWGEGPYGRELQDMTAHLPARNSLSTNDTARLLQEIALGRCVTPARSAQMLELLARDPAKAASGDPDDQATGFTGQALAPGMKLWSKAGWMSSARHDAALIGLPGGGRIIIVTFTEGKEHAGNRAIIASVARRILAALPSVAPEGEARGKSPDGRFNDRRKPNAVCDGPVIDRRYELALTLRTSSAGPRRFSRSRPGP